MLSIRINAQSLAPTSMCIKEIGRTISSADAHIVVRGLARYYGQVVQYDQLRQNRAEVMNDTFLGESYVGRQKRVALSEVMVISLRNLHNRAFAIERDDCRRSIAACTTTTSTWKPFCRSRYMRIDRTFVKRLCQRLDRRG